MACGNLGVANDFNVFVFGNHKQSFVDSGGRVAVGGKATYDSYGIGSALPVSQTRADLIVGDSMDITSGTNFSGNSVISPTGTIIKYTMTNNNHVTGQPLRGTPVDFAAARQYLTCASTSWGSLSPNGTAQVNFGQITLTGSSSALNIFTINGNNVAGSGVSLTSANGINIVAPLNSTILINITGTSVGFGSYAIFRNGGQSTPAHGALILWNFFQATNAFNLNLSIKGSVLAPFAAWSASGYGNIDGTLVAASLANTTGSIEEHNVPFTGCLPEVACTPRLTLAKTVNGGSSVTGLPGTPLTYVITVTNSGIGTLSNIQVNDPLLNFQQTIPQLPAGKSMQFTIQSEIQQGPPGSSYQNTVTAQSSLTPPQSASVTITIEQGTIIADFHKSVQPSEAMPGDGVIYTFTVDIPPFATLNNVRLVDPTLGIDMTFPSFTGGQLLQVPFTIPANAPIGSNFVNTATVTASNLSAPLTDSASVFITETPSVTLSKEADTATAIPGQTIFYTITVTNTSKATTLFNLTLTDPLLQLSQTITKLDPQTSVVFNGMYTVPPLTPAGAVIHNTATLVSTLGTETASTNVLITPAPMVTITKTPSAQLVPPGSVVEYTIVVTNTGNIPLTNVTISDPELSYSETIPVLPIGVQHLAVVPFVIPLGTPAGTKLFNTALVTTDQTSTATATAEVSVAAVFSLSVLKTVDPTTALPGETVLFSIVVTNTSNTILTNVVITDPLLLLNETIPVLEAEGSVIFDIPYTIPAGMPAGSLLINTVTADSDQTQPQSASVQVVIGSAPSLALNKTVTPTSGLPGTPITYTFTVVNTGNTPLTAVRVQDPLLGVDTTIPSIPIGGQSSFDVPSNIPALPPGTIVHNIATAVSAETPTPVSADAYVTVGTPPTLTLTKSVSDATALPGETVTFTITLVNTSAITLTNVHLVDPFFFVDYTFDSLEAGDSRIIEADFTIPPGTIAGTVFTNVATVSSDQTPPISADASITTEGFFDLAVAKTVNFATALPGQTVEFTLEVANTGNTTLFNVTVSDPFLGFQTVIAELQPGGVQTCMLPFTIPADAVPGTTYTNTITASTAETGDHSASASVVVVPIPPGEIKVQKLVSTLTASPGETIFYTILVYNASSGLVTNIQINDPVIGVSETVAELPPNSLYTLSATYVIPAGTPGGTVITNTVTVAALGETQQASVSVTVNDVPALAITKTADPVTASPGDIVNYTITVQNAGNVPLTNVVVTDAALGFSTVIPELAIGASQSLVVPFVVPALPPGTIITNTASATADQVPTPVTASASISVDTPASIFLEKTVTPSFAAPGETVVFTIEAVNTSGITLTNVVIVDELLGLFIQAPLVPAGLSRTIVVDYTIPPETPAGTVITNAVTVTSDQTLPASSEASVTVTPAPALTVRKIESQSTAFPGETVNYTIIVTNTGNEPLTNIHLTDSLLGLNQTVTLLNPQNTFTMDVPFEVPSSGLTAGARVFNTVVATSDQSDPASATTNLTILPVYSIDVLKTATPAEALPGAVITFETTVTNTSNTVLTNVELSDPLLSISETVTTLDVGESFTLVAEYTVPARTPADSFITNVVTANSSETPPSTTSSSVLVLPDPRLSLTKLLPPIGLPGQQLDMTLFFINSGNLTLHNILLVDGPLRFHLEELVPGASEIGQLWFSIPTDAQPGSQIVNTAVITSNETAPVEASQTVNVVGLLIEKSSSSLSVNVRDTITYNVIVRNPTPYPAQNVVLRDPLPGEAVFVSGSVWVNGERLVDASPGAAGIPIGTIAAGAYTTVSFKARLKEEPPGGKLDNQANASFTFTAGTTTVSGTSLSNIWTVRVFDEEE
ncbi:putative repeat protein (TIGR01451 family)/choice-of-anchor A domain-containing protein [Paenibacillus taihuensis]|uniref:Putative repeat protein (TIGR01451 family)/choice-of-anchor A domain-containing protein n=1 Tax=Paenibacillus taihuensis TaxID=1156355 RepID=A0A3D9QWH6_9BACL|nr:choice-of-anchor A family protein [Paenibacillus taihuensis]REE70461.1 putative repeat protein (TIGR01451 family)/choice-of-anchor A domain-containing protein [Paenibacillus taihuensis]